MIISVDAERPFGYISKGKEISMTDICTPMFIVTLFTIAKTWKRVSTDEMDKT